MKKICINRALFIIMTITTATVTVILIILMVIRFEQIGFGIRKCSYKEKDLIERYGKDSWVVVTGASSGQGRQFALQFAKRGFHLVLIGSNRTSQVVSEIGKNHPLVKIKVIIKNFGKALEEGFFEHIKQELQPLLDKKQISVLINNVGHRTGWIPYHEMPEKLIKETIVCGTVVQSMMSRMLIPHLISRDKRSAIIFITAQTLHPNFFLGHSITNEIYLPYLSVYEGANNFGFTHANSLFKEYKGQLDFLNITPGAVKTENTESFLKDTIFAVDCEKFVSNIIRMLGNFDGTTCASIGHSLSTYLVNMAPWAKDKILRKTGRKIAEHYMKNEKSY